MEAKQRTYQAMVRSSLEYCSPIWSPWQQQNINKIESVQRKAARFVLSKPHRRSAPDSVTSMIQQLEWQSLQSRRENASHVFLYRLLNGHLEVPAGYLPAAVTSNTRARHGQKFQHLQANVDSYRHSFMPRTIPSWNLLPAWVVEAESTDAFKAGLGSEAHA